MEEIKSADIEGGGNRYLTAEIAKPLRKQHTCIAEIDAAVDMRRRDRY